MFDDDRHALKRLTDLWDPWYRVRVSYSKGAAMWHAERRDSDAAFSAGSPEVLNVALINHFMTNLGQRLGAPRPLDTAQEAVLAQVRKKHCMRWDFIGRDLETPGWRASRQIKPNVSHHIAAATLAELDEELDALEREDESVRP